MKPNVQNNLPHLTHLGGHHCVTGSCHLVQAEGVNILVDCGIVQGRDEAIPISSWTVKPSQMHFLFLTHAHMDHMGRIPELVDAGFRGEILTTHPTRFLMLPMMDDATGFTLWTDRKRARIHKTIDELAWGFEYDQVFDLRKGIRFQMRRAGHILGSCSIRLEGPGSGWSICFSGDLGARGTPLLPDPDPLDPCDVLVLESTYGGSFHESRKHRLERLGQVLSHALADGGKVLIPAFALGRTQELLYELDRLAALGDMCPPGSSAEADAAWTRGSTAGQVRWGMKELEPSGLEDGAFIGEGIRAGAKKAFRDIPVFLDSPLGLAVTKIYSELPQYWDREARGLLKTGDHPMDFERLYAVRSHEEHLKLLEMDGPAVIIAGSGMCTGGRIVNHLKNGLEVPTTDVLFVGYQADGTLGRRIVEAYRSGDGSVDIEGERYDLRAQVHALGGYSAHADQKGLVEWVQSADRKPGEIRVVHGERRAREALARVLSGLGYEVWSG